jgi:hypothetical protein
MAKEKFNIYLPCFPGFYNTVLEPQCYNNAEHADYDIIPNIGELEYGTNLEDRKYVIEFYAEVLSQLCTNFDEDPSEAEKYAMERFAEILEFNIRTDLGIYCDISLSSIEQISPREYNFTNDKIQADVEVDPAELLEELNKHLPEFEQFIKDNFTSCDGFISFVSNNSCDWLSDLERLAKGEDTEEVESWHIIRYVLEFLLLNSNKDYWQYGEYIDEIGISYCDFKPTDELTEFCEHPKVIKAVFKLINEANKTKEYLKSKYPDDWRKRFNKLFDNYVKDEVNDLIDKYFEK